MPNCLVSTRKLKTDDLKPIATIKLNLLGFRKLLTERVSYSVDHEFRRPKIVVIYGRALRSLICWSFFFSIKKVFEIFLNVNEF